MCPHTPEDYNPEEKRSASCARNRSKKLMDGANKRSAGRGGRKRKPLNGVKMRNAG